MVALGERLGVRRLCVHADEWAAAVTRGDAEQELDALMTGSLIAAARAEAGGRCAVGCRPAGAGSASRRSGRDAVPERLAVRHLPVPYLDRPASTLGLGRHVHGRVPPGPRVRTEASGPQIHKLAA